MQSPLQAHSLTFEKSVDEIDRVMLEHKLAMACGDVQEVIAVGLGLFDTYDRLDAQWRQGIRAGHAHYHLEQGLELKTTNDRLISARNKLLLCIDLLENNGYILDGAEFFRSRVLIAFDDRALDVPFTDDDFQALAAVGPKAPEDERD